MKYLEVYFNIHSNEAFVKDILSSQLAEIGFESFSDNDENPYVGYIQKKLFNKDSLDQLVREFEWSNNISYSIKEAEDKDWNEEWEKNYFQPIVIENQCVIHSSFHKDVPTAKYDIVINPKLAFGTGYHATTTLMLKAVLEGNMNDKKILDMGCGTAIIAILAGKCGAKKIVGIDIDHWAFENAKENIVMNGQPDIELREGGAEQLHGNENFDIIFANINRNILLQDMKFYAENLSDKGFIYMSGFYETDIPVLNKEAESIGLKFISHEVFNNWCRVLYKKV